MIHVRHMINYFLATCVCKNMPELCKNLLFLGVFLTSHINLALTFRFCRVFIYIFTKKEFVYEVRKKLHKQREREKKIIVMPNFLPRCC